MKVVILTTFDDSDYILNAINNGASGYLLKDIGSTALIDAVKNAYAGDTILPAKIARPYRGRGEKRFLRPRNQAQARLFPFRPRGGDRAYALRGLYQPPDLLGAENLRGHHRNYISAIYVKTGSENRSGAVEAIKSVL